MTSPSVPWSHPPGQTGDTHTLVRPHHLAGVLGMDGGARGRSHICLLILHPFHGLALSSHTYHYQLTCTATYICSRHILQIIRAYQY